MPPPLVSSYHDGQFPDLETLLPQTATIAGHPTSHCAIKPDARPAVTDVRRGRHSRKRSHGRGSIGGDGFVKSSCSLPNAL